MKKLATLIAAAALVVTPMTFGGTASAASTCPVGYTTGPASTNTCVSTTTYKCEVTNNNDFEVTDNNNQTVFTGTATNQGNTQGGSSASGNASNNSDVNLDVQITNSGANGNGVCTAVATVPATPTKPVAPTAEPGKGAAKPVTAPAKPVATVLPDTSSNQTVGMIAGIMAIVATAAVATRLGVSAFSRFNR